MLGNGAMLTFTDVSQDPTAFARSGLRSALFAEATALGFDPIGWIAATPAPIQITAVLAARDGRTLATLTRTRGLEEVAFATLIDDGTVVETRRKPTKGWWYLRWGMVVPRTHAYALDTFEVRSLSGLFAIHQRRVAAEEVYWRRPIQPHDLRAHLAMRKRFQEIVDPRMQLQQAIAGWIGVGTLVAAGIGSLIGAQLLAPNSVVAVLLDVLGLLASASLGYAAFVGALASVAPILARGAKAPLPRPARELLTLADDVPRSSLPPPGAPSTAPESPRRLALSPRELAHLQQMDLRVSIGSALVFPLTGFAAIATLGAPGVWAMLAVVYTGGALIALATKKSAGEVLREYLVPELVEAERAAAVPCATSTCGIRRHWLSLVVGVAACVTTYSGLSVRGHGPGWLLLAWAAIAAVVVGSSVATAKKRHRSVTAQWGVASPKLDHRLPQ